MRTVWSALVASCCLLVVSIPAYADVTIVPPDIKLATVRGEGLSKTIQISSSAPLKALQIIPSDLERVDNRGRLMARDVQIQLPQTTANASQVIQVELGIRGDRWTQSGEFSGSLLVQYDGGQQVVPVTIRVKDRVAWPLVFLIAGVALGLGLTWYRTHGLQRDDLVVRLGNLRTQMRGEVAFSEAGLGQGFRQRIEEHLIEVEAALSDRAWELAETESTQARAVWRRWRKGREDWLMQLTYQQSLLTQVEKLKELRLGQDLAIELETIKRQAVDDPAPEVLRQKLLRCRTKVEQVLQAKAAIEALQTTSEVGIRALPEAERDGWRKRRNQLRADLARLSLDETRLPEETEAFQQWRDQVDRFGQDLEAAVQALTVMGPKGIPELTERQSSATAAPWDPVESSPAVRSLFDDPTTFNRSRLTLLVFRWSVQVIALIFLAWAGFNNLYAQNPTFGAARSSDYFALLAWGFGAEVTRESVVKAIRGFGIAIGPSEAEDQS